MKVLIVIDMIKGFCRPGHPLSLSQPTAAIEQYVRRRVEETYANGGQSVFMCDAHQPDDPEIGQPYPPHCMAGTTEAELVESLALMSAKSTVLTKRTLSIFQNTGLERLLSEWSPTEVEVTGVCTDICVLFAVYELRIRGYQVVVAEQGVMALVPERQLESLAYFEQRLGATVKYSMAD